MEPSVGRHCLWSRRVGLPQALISREFNSSWQNNHNKERLLHFHYQLKCVLQDLYSGFFLPPKQVHHRVGRTLLISRLQRNSLVLLYSSWLATRCSAQFVYFSSSNDSAPPILNLTSHDHIMLMTPTTGCFYARFMLGFLVASLLSELLVAPVPRTASGFPSGFTVQ